MASVGEQTRMRSGNAPAAKARLYGSISRLSDWLEANDYQAYDAFDGLNARYVRPLILETKLLRVVLQQGVRRFPINLRPLLGVRKSRSTKAMGFIARGFIRLHDATGERAWRDRAEYVLKWLIDNQRQGYSGAGWGNHFDYQSRNCYVVKNIPSMVWTSLISHAFLDAHAHLRDGSFLRVAVSSCEHILSDHSRHVD